MQTQTFEIKSTKTITKSLTNLITESMAFYYKKDEFGQLVADRVACISPETNGLQGMINRGEVFEIAISENDQQQDNQQKVIACMSLKKKINDQGQTGLYIGMLCVDKKYQNKKIGLGTKLMNFAEKQCPGNGYLELDVYYHEDLPFTEVLINWYTKLGYKKRTELGTYESHLIRDEIESVMTLEKFREMPYDEVLKAVYEHEYRNIILRKYVQ